MRPPSWFLRRLRAIDPDLGLEWLPREQKWAVVQRLWNTPSLEETTGQVATQVIARLREGGYQPSRDAVAAAAYALVSQRAIVLRVEDPNGAPRPLDGRALVILEQMAHNVRNRSAVDWQRAVEALDYEAKRQRERAEEDLWRYAAQDKVFSRIVSDLAAGLKIQHTVGGPLPASDAPTPKEMPCSS